MSDSNRDESSGSADRNPSPPRRGFLAGAASLLIGGICGGFSFLVGLFVMADPLSRKAKTPKFYEKPQGEFGEGYVRVASMDAIPADGVPRRFPVIDDLHDAWNFVPATPIGSIYVRRDPDSDEVSVLHTTCPHAGCSVSYRHDADPELRTFHCPCHNSAFAVNGEKLDSAGGENPSPRNMDDLDAQVDGKGDIWVKYEDYYTGVHDKKAKI